MKMPRWFTHNLTLAAGIALSLTAATTHAAPGPLPYCADVFANGLQTFGHHSYIAFDYNAQIVNPSSTELNTGRVDNHLWSIRKSCVTDDCAVSGVVADRPHEKRRLKTNSKHEVVIPAHKKITLGADNINEFRRIQVGEWGTAVFSAEQDVFIIDELDVGYKSSVRLTAGEYWIRNLNLEVESRINVMGEGTVHLYVLNPLQVPMNVKLNTNNANPSQLTLYTYGRAEFHVGTHTYGFVRAESELYLHHRAKISGGAIARLIDMGTETQLAYDATAAQKLDFPNICRPMPAVEPGDTTPPEIVELISPGVTTQRTALVGAIVRDTGDSPSGIASVSVLTSQGEIPLQASGDSYTAELTLAAGENPLMFVAIDNAGNRSEMEASVTLVSPPRIENLRYPQNTETQPIIITGEVHTYWDAEDVTLLIADNPVALIPVSDGVYQFEASLNPDGFTNRFWISVWNTLNEGHEEIHTVFYHPPAFYVDIDQKNLETTADTITLTGTFGIPPEEFGVEIMGVRAFGYTSPVEAFGTIEYIDENTGRFSVEIPLMPGENEFGVQIISTPGQFPWENGAIITRTSP